MNNTQKNSITFLDDTGDTTIMWDEKTNPQMEKIIRQKIEEGFTFFIVEPRILPFLPPKKVKATLEDIKESGMVVVKDEDIHKLFTKGDVQIEHHKDDAVKTITKKVSRVASEIVSNQSIALRPVKGG